MYGIVNNAVKGLVIQLAGEQAWKEITAAAGYPELTICDSENYSDEVTLAIAVQITKTLEIDLHTLLHTLGKYWVGYTETQGWHRHFELSGNNLIGVLESLDSLHHRINDAMPDAQMPSFCVAPCEHGYTLEYHSSRDGFAPMVLGILEGLAEHFDEKWEFEHIGLRSELSFDTFLMRSVSNAHGDHDAVIAA